MMYWKDKIIEGMKLIKKGCEKAHDDINKCDDCPFVSYCDAITLEYYREPFKWEIEKNGLER